MAKSDKWEININLKLFVMIHQKVAFMFLVRKGSSSNTAMAVREQPWKHLGIKLRIVPYGLQLITVRGHHSPTPITPVIPATSNSP